LLAYGVEKPALAKLRRVYKGSARQS